MLPAIVLSVFVAIAPAVIAPPFPRVRPMSEDARALVDDAARRSPTIARLLRIIDRSDAVVYIDLRFDVRGEGVTTLFAASPYCRFIRVTIAKPVTGYRRIEMLGHELQHAVEIIQAPGVRDSAGMRRLFNKIGWLLGDLTFESNAAIDTEREVRRELRTPALKR
jgi:hypothetical protein